MLREGVILPGGLFDNLVGDWELTGKMGDTPLRQHVSAVWTLGGLFLRVHCRSTLPTPHGQPPYEALYLIGHNEADDVYVLNLFDTFGVARRPVPGVGRQEGNSVPFVFEYDQGPWTNRFTWFPEKKSWTNEITYFKDDELRTFATKLLTPSAGSYERNR